MGQLEESSELTLDFLLDERARELYMENWRRSDLIRFGKYTKGYNWDWKGINKNTKLDGGIEPVGHDIDDRYKNTFDVVIITIGALCWFDDLNRFFAVIAKCMKPGAIILINEEHPFRNMLAAEGDEPYDPEHRAECHFSYFEHEWTGNGGMYYMTQKHYQSKTFTDYTHSLSEIISGMCGNGIVVTGLQEFDHDIGGGFVELDHQGFPLSMIIQGRKI